MVEQERPRTVAVRDVPEAGRYVASIDGREAGFLAYHRVGDRVVARHTEVDPAWDGHGVGSALARAVLDDARRAGTLVAPVCPFVAAWLTRHPDYLDVVEPSYRTRLQDPPEPR